MKQSVIIVLIAFGTVILYCAKIFIQASANASCDSMDAYYSILGWTLYLAGCILFIGGIVAQGVKLVMALTGESKR